MNREYHDRKEPQDRRTPESGGNALWVLTLSTFLISTSSPALAQMGLGESHVLRVQLCDCTDLEPAIPLGLREEAGRIYATAGIDIRWENDCDTSPAELRASNAARVYIVEKLPNSLVYRFKHTLKKSNLMAYNLTDPGGMPGAVIYVSLEAVLTNADQSRTIPEHLSRALGRVVAHELAHRFIQKQHTNRGILKGRFGRGDLVDEDADLEPFFSPKQIKVLSARAAGRPPVQ